MYIYKDVQLERIMFALTTSHGRRRPSCESFPGAIPLYMYIKDGARGTLQLPLAICAHVQG